MNIQIEITRAIRIARNTIIACESELGIVAGAHHFVDLWARDSFFATNGLNRKKDLPIFKKTIETFITHQRSDGLIPYRVMRSKSSLAKYFGKPQIVDVPTANFYSHMSLGLVPDGGLTAIIAAAQYIQRSANLKWLRVHYPSLKQAMDWYQKKFGESLITEWFQCEWADGVLKSGKTLYTNVLYIKALRDMVFLAKKIGDISDSATYNERADTLFHKFHKEFWNGTYFVDWIDWKRQEYFTSHANFLAIIYGLTTKKEALSILDYAKTYCLNTFTLHNVYPAYPFWRIPLIQTIGGVHQYHNRGILWLQPGITYALALHRTGNHREAKKFLMQIATHILKYTSVYEVYELDGTPVQRLLYTSEGPFAWSAGLFLWATHEIYGLN